MSAERLPIDAETIAREGPRRFVSVSEGRYRMAIPESGITLDIDRLRRKSNELIGELAVGCDLPGARTYNGMLSIADFNMSSARARLDRAKMCAARAATNNSLDWTGLLEEFCQRVLQAERDGKPAVSLRDLPAKTSDDVETIAGITIPMKHPTILFGDGGTAKSYIALYIAGTVSSRGAKAALFDWELDGEDHRDRLGRLFPGGMPDIVYARCERDLVHEKDRLSRIVRESSVDFAIYDSVAFASDGPPEAAEVAGRYFRAVREIGVGSLHIAHVSKSEGADKRPFGSSFWHNSARMTWNVQTEEQGLSKESLTVGMFNRKSNLGRIQRPVGYRLTFGRDVTTVELTSVADSPDLAPYMSIRQRMAHLLRSGSMSAEQVAEELNANVDTIKRTARRAKGLFTVLDGGRKLGLATREEGW